MATQSRTANKSVNRLRQKFEEKDAAHQPAASGSAPNSPQMCRPGRFGVAKRIGQKSGESSQIHRRSSESAVLVSRRNVSSSSQGTSGSVAVKNGKSAFQPQKESPLISRRCNRQLSENAANSRGTQGVVKGNKFPGPKPALPAKPTLPVKPMYLTVIKRGKSVENLVETQPIRKEKSNVKNDSETGSQTPEEGKPSSVAERARLFSAEEPRAGAIRQRKQSPAGAGALTFKAWEESGDQGDDEDNLSDSTNQKQDVEQPKLLETRVADTERGRNISSSTKKVLAEFSENLDSDNEHGSYNVWEGSDCEARVIPLRPNKLLQSEFAPTTGRSDLRRVSSLEDLPTISVSFSNARGLFQQAQFMKSCETVDTTAKPPIPNKPPVFKKPALSSSQDGLNSKPGVPPKKAIGSPPRPTPKPKIALKPSEQSRMDNIYDEVYHEGMEASEPTGIRNDRAPSKKLEKFFGPDFVASERAGSGDEKSTKTGKGEKPVVDIRLRKISAPARSKTVDREGPYAVIPLPDADKTESKKTKNPAEQKTREISDGNGNKVVLRNSGGMSSGDSGIAGLHLEASGMKRIMSKRERRMSRRLLRQKIKSMDSDFTEDSDDEPIGADSDFDSDSSLEEPNVFLDDTHQKAFEVLTTERTYVDTLHLISEIFMKQIEEENKEKAWFNHSFINEIFSNIASIYQLHSAVLLPDLEQTLKNWEKNPCLGEVLKKNAPFLKLYSDYVSNFDHAMKQLKDLMSKAPKFAAKLAELQQHELCGNLALQHHMLTPIQRIPRYELLLKEYLRKLPDESKDKADAEKALVIISGAAQHSNDMMKSMEQFEKLLKINEKIDEVNVIDPTRHLLKEGKMTMIVAKNKEDRYIFLFNDILLCCEKKRSLTSTTYKVKLKMEVDDEMKVLDSDSCGFIVVSKTKSIQFKTNSEEDREEWMRVLLSAIQEMVRKMDTFRTNNAAARNLKDQFIPGKTEPQWIKDDETSMCMRCGTDFKLTKRRHHCRACGAVACHKCCSFEAELEFEGNRVCKVCVKCSDAINGKNDESERISSTIRQSLIDIDEDNSFGSFLYLHQRGAWTKFWVVVTEENMFVLKAPKDVRAVITVPIKRYSIKSLSDTDSDRAHVFRLSCSEARTEKYTLSAESKELKRRWMAVLTQGVQEISKTMTF